MTQKDSKNKPLSKKKLEKAARSELKKRTAKSEKKAAKASKLSAKKATAKKVGAAKQAAPAKKVATTRVPRTPAAKPAEPSPTWTVVALRAHAREVGIIGYSRMKKDELLVELRAR